MADQEELLDYEEEENQEQAGGAAGKADASKKGYVGIHSTSFKDMLLKEPLFDAIQRCGFEHPSEVQHEAIPQALMRQDILCQAKSGMGKTAVFVISILQNLEPKKGTVQALVLCHTRELSFQICREFERFGKPLNVKVGNFFGGMDIKAQKDMLKDEDKCPDIVVGTPGRIKQLVLEKHLSLKQLKFFVIDECDKVLEKHDMRGDVQAIFKETPHDKQVMMFSATLAKDIRGVCKKFMNKVRAPWKAAADPLPRPAAGDAGLAPVAVLAASRSSPSTPSRAPSMQACFRQHQRPPGQVAPQPTTTLAAGRRGAVAEVAVPQPHSQLTSSPWWAAQAPPQLAAVVAG